MKRILSTALIPLLLIGSLPLQAEGPLGIDPIEMRSKKKKNRRNSPSPVGPTGPTGPAGVANASAYISLEMTNALAPLSQEGDSSFASFNAPSPYPKSGITFPTARDNSMLTVNQAGMYLITWSYNASVNGPGSAQITDAIVVNEAAVQPHTFTVSSTDPAHFSRQIMIELNEGDTVQLQFTAAPSSVETTIAPVGGLYFSMACLVNF
jgi:hypothetical protein